MLALRSTRRQDGILFEAPDGEVKTIFVKKKLRVIGHNPNSTKFQLASGCMRNNVWTDFFHVIQRILQQAAPDQGISSWSRTWWGSYCGQPNGLALTKDRTSSKFCDCFSTFFVMVFLCVLFYIKFLFFAVNTMSLLGIQTTICVSLNSK